MIRSIIILSMLLLPLYGTPQSTIEGVLQQVERNNKSLQSERQFLEAEKIVYRTGLLPVNPRVEYDYMYGRPVEGGNQTDLQIIQPLDFPTTYFNRRKVSKEQVLQAEHKFEVARQEVLLDAKLVCLGLIYRNKLAEQLVQQLQSADKLLQAMSQKAVQGEINTVELNKIRLFRLEIKNSVEQNDMAVVNLKHRLTELNGNIAPDFNVLVYPALPETPGFEALDSLFEILDPMTKVYRKDISISNRQVALSKSISLPKLEAGYHYQSLLGQVYQGFHVSTTIPLFENMNRVKAQVARLSFNEIQLVEHRIQRQSTNRRVYESYWRWEGIVREYQELLTASGQEAMLGKALEAGQISLIEYLMEMRYQYNAVGQLLHAENQLHNTVATLYKFTL